jgi:hypothetical protein
MTSKPMEWTSDHMDIHGVDIKALGSQRTFMEWTSEHMDLHGVDFKSKGEDFKAQGHPSPLLSADSLAESIAEYLSPLLSPLQSADSLAESIAEY